MTRRLPFHWQQHRDVGEGATSLPELIHFIFDPDRIMHSLKQGGIKYHFFTIWYDSTWDWTPVSRTIGEHTHTHTLSLSISLFHTLSLSLSIYIYIWVDPVFYNVENLELVPFDIIPY